ncbi:MAG TPA: hypothetical protein VGQ06_15550 [Gemmatimonadales bacterium]|jgi:hypothetical protein|nr:hypothetical protein [Gemmatimonadales bacterium]
MRYRLLVVAAAAGLVACGDAVRVVKQTLAIQESFFRQIDQRSPTPEIRNTLRALARGSGDSVQSLVANGLLRLDDSTLIRRMELMAAMMEASDTVICAAIVRGNAGSSQMTLAMTQLQGPDLEDWIGLLVEAQVAQLEQRKAHEVTSAALTRSVEAAVASLPDSEQNRMGDVLSGLEAASDGDACWAGRGLFRQGAALPEPHRSTFARGLVQP